MCNLRHGSPIESEYPWLKFALEMRVPNEENAQPTNFTPVTPPPGTAAGAGLEQDRIIPLEVVEAQFDQPVEIAVSFEGLIDLSTLGAEIMPFLTTLDEASDT